MHFYACSLLNPFSYKKKYYIVTRHINIVITYSAIDLTWPDLTSSKNNSFWPVITHPVCYIYQIRIVSKNLHPRYLFINIRMCNVISGSDPPIRTESTACFTFSVGDMSILISSPKTLGLWWFCGSPKRSEAAFLISTWTFFRKNWAATASVVFWNLPNLTLNFDSTNLINNSW